MPACHGRPFMTGDAASPTLASDFEAAYSAGTDVYEEEARRRAFGESDALLIFLLKSRNPERFNRIMIAIGGDPDAPAIAMDHTHSTAETVRLRLPDNGRAIRTCLPAGRNHCAVEIVDLADGRVLNMNLDGRQVPGGGAGRDAGNAWTRKPASRSNGKPAMARRRQPVEFDLGPRGAADTCASTP